MIDRLRLFFSSIGRFCEGCFLFPLYGCGDLAPGFCRSSAVRGGVFALNWCPAGYVVQTLTYHNVCDKIGYLFVLKSELKGKSNNSNTNNDTNQNDNNNGNNSENEKPRRFGVYCVTNIDSKTNECEYINLFESNSNKKKIELSKLEYCLENSNDCDVIPLIGSEFITGNCRFEIMDVTKELVAKCRLILPQTAGNSSHSNMSPRLLSAISSDISLELTQLLFVRFVSFNFPKIESNTNNTNNKVSHFTGIISNSNQFIKAKNLVSSVDYFSQMINKVKIQHYRMVVISDGPLNNSMFSNDSDENNSESESESEESSDESDDENETRKSKTKGKTKNTNTNTNNNSNGNCVAHIPPQTKPFDNPFSIHIIQLDHTSCTVPAPLYLTYFWTLAEEKIDNDSESEARASLERCCNAFYRNNLFERENEGKDGKKPLLLCSSIYEQKLRCADIKNVPNNVQIIQDLTDTLGYRVAAQRVLFCFVLYCLYCCSFFCVCCFEL